MVVMLMVASPAAAAAASVPAAAGATVAVATGLPASVAHAERGRIADPPKIDARASKILWSCAGPIKGPWSRCVWRNANT